MVHNKKNIGRICPYDMDVPDFSYSKQGLKFRKEKEVKSKIELRILYIVPSFTRQYLLVLQEMSYELCHITTKSFYGPAARHLEH
jgi:hypothetical protein